MHQKVYDDFVGEILELAENVVMGEPLSEEVWQADNAPDRFGLGPLVSSKQKTRAEDLLQRTLDEGAKVLYQGKVPEQWVNGYFFPLTILESQRLDDTLAHEEIFAPVLVVRKVKSVHEALEIINEKRIGIVACIHTCDMNLAEFFIQNALRTALMSTDTGQVHCGEQSLAATEAAAQVTLHWTARWFTVMSCGKPSTEPTNLCDKGFFSFRLNHSTVTLFAKFLGLSTSRPFIAATWWARS